MNDEAEAAPLNNADRDGDGSAGLARDSDDGDEPKKTLRKALLRQLEDLLFAFDSIIYAELAVLYYMDLSFFRLFLRGTIQLFYLTPKPDLNLPVPPMSKRPFVGAIIGSNILCLLLHLCYSPPQAGEATRGYLHGGMVIDFIGQTPVSEGWLGKGRLCLLDLVVLGLQLGMMSVVAKVEKVKKKEARPVSAALANRQDHDAEERGVFRRSSTDSRAPEEERATQEHDELDALLGDESVQSTSVDDELAEMYSGQAVVLDMHVLQTVREQYRAYQDRPADASGAAVSGVQGIAEGLSLGRRLLAGVRR